MRARAIIRTSTSRAARRRVLRSLAVCVIACVTCATRAAPTGRAEPDPEPVLVLPDESAYSPSPQDGLGRVTVSPTHVPVRSPVTLTFVFTVGAKGIATGGGIICNVSNFWRWTPPQDRDPSRPGYVTVKCSNADADLDITVDPANQVIVALAREGGLEGGQTITIVYGDTSDGRHPSAKGISDAYAERGERFFFKVDGDGDGWFASLAEQPRFDVVADRPAKLAIFGPSWANVGQPFDLCLSVLDPTNNLVESFRGAVTLSAKGTSINCPATVTLRPQDRGTTRVSATATAPGVIRIVASDPAGALASAQSNPTIVSGDGPTEYTLYWADLHSHSNASDGSGDPEDLFRYARDVARLDVYALTDHDHWGYRPLTDDPATWCRLRDLAKSWNEPGRFVTFPGYEWTNWTFGHRHVLYMHECEAEVFGWPDPRSDHPRELWALLDGRDCLTIPHHPGGAPIPICWKYWDPRFEPVVEIASVHGVSEYVGHPRSIGSPSPSGMVQAALARGYRLGIVASGDTHDGHPGLGSPGARAGLAGIYAKELTREAVFEAIRARRVYATTGSRTILRFRMGDVPMGGVAKLRSPTDTRTFSVVVLGDAPIAGVTIVKNNRDVANQPGGGWMTSVQWADPHQARDGDYYYARIAQADNEWTWSSPIYIELEPEARTPPATQR